MNKVCVACKKVFPKNPKIATAQWDKQKFCSQSCRAKTIVPTKETRRKISLGQGGNGTPQYHAVHVYVRRRLPKPELCDDCKKPAKLELSNIPGTYKENLEDWKWVCKSCHLKHDYKTGRRFVRFAPVVQISNGKIIARFGSQAEAARETGSNAAGISFVLRGFNRSAGGFQWAYEGKPEVKVFPNEQEK